MANQPCEQRIDQHEQQHRRDHHDPGLAVGIGEMRPTTNGERTIWIAPVSRIAENATDGASPNCRIAYLGMKSHEVSRHRAQHHRSNGDPSVPCSTRRCRAERWWERRREIPAFRRGACRCSKPPAQSASRRRTAHVSTTSSSVRAKGCRQHHAKDSRQERGQPLARDLPAHEETAPAGNMFSQKRRCAAELAASRKALHQAREHQDQWRGNSD